MIPVLVVKDDFDFILKAVLDASEKTNKDVSNLIEYLRALDEIKDVSDEHLKYIGARFDVATESIFYIYE